MNDFINWLMYRLQYETVYYGGTFPLADNSFYEGNEIILYTNSQPSIREKIKDIYRYYFTTTGLAYNYSCVQYGNNFQITNCLEAWTLTIKVRQHESKLFRYSSPEICKILYSDMHPEINDTRVYIHVYDQWSLALMISDDYHSGEFDETHSYDENSLWLYAIDEGLINIQELYSIYDITLLEDYESKLRADRSNDFYDLYNSEGNEDKLEFINQLFQYLSRMCKGWYTVNGNCMPTLECWFAGSTLEIYFSNTVYAHHLEDFIRQYCSSAFSIFSRLDGIITLYFNYDKSYLNIKPIYTACSDDATVYALNHNGEYTVQYVHQSYYVYKILCKLIELKSNVTKEDILTVCNYSLYFDANNDEIYQYNFPIPKENISNLCERVKLQMLQFGIETNNENQAPFNNAVDMLMSIYNNQYPNAYPDEVFCENYSNRIDMPEECK